MWHCAILAQYEIILWC